MFGNLGDIEKWVYPMAALRFLSGLCELTGCFAMLWYGTVGRALQVNGLLALVGPVILVSVTALGLTGLAGEVRLWRMALVVIGVGLVLYGSRP
ncbi:spermidine synthase [Alicyclobacillus hesperidum URH17-3-68]|uniref:Uncharacterized protein n=1 Tax=Alicyclobacillus hesperidum TaxID=89784 RepID=A0A1H2T585_9BACL|nr:YqhV family protein [Alicyclobacillus hesperidum]KRW91982.1 hypothetical protein SD51_05660 [Alicyclobacillus tengchongensis]EJY55930.1 spermidine synthase [Alicyclobacillus hesperidum URH17-3-68]SDW39113.1 Protein of unknown function [Alicyclobacillus hesperidum]GLG00954.1 hypothetical protein Alches_09930 [Alicyclobacillus hesperidum subsp. aegles]GLV13768.1 hypothetical protein Heshes_14520 [Alicyclobacillus hesperidum]